MGLVVPTMLMKSNGAARPPQKHTAAKCQPVTHITFYYYHAPMLPQSPLGAGMPHFPTHWQFEHSLLWHNPQCVLHRVPEEGGIQWQHPLPSFWGRSDPSKLLQYLPKPGRCNLPISSWPAASVQSLLCMWAGNHDLTYIVPHCTHMAFSAARHTTRHSCCTATLL
jgi:hypothetical protein